MKTYHLRLLKANFTNQAGSGRPNVWRSQIWDLYNNAQYKNYTSKKSNYGTNLLGDGTYTGLNKYSPTTSEIGFVESGRFIDTSGRIDVISWQLNFTTINSADIISSFNVYTSTSASSTQAYLGDWSATNNIIPGDDIYVINSGRYAFFELELTSDMSMSTVDFEVYVVIEIDPPVINGYFTGTKALQNKFPEWMALREYDPSDPLGATPATPTSVGGQFLNAVAGEWLTDLQSKLQYQQYQFFINSVDTTQKAWVYRGIGLPQFVYSIKGDGVELTKATDIEDFHKSLSTEDVGFWNQSTREIYVNKKYTIFTVNGVALTGGLTEYQVWNSIDDIGTTVDLFRLPLEDNNSFKLRILDVYRNPSGVSMEAFQLAMRRELNLWKYWGSTPNSDYLGATPNVSEIQDIESNSEFFGLDGMPTTKFINLVTELAETYPITWGYFLWNNSFWDLDGLEGKGFNTLPRQFDATPISAQYLESGVGDGNDMYMFRPQGYTGLNQFTGKLKVRGRQKTTRTEYVPLTFDVKVYGTAAENYYTNPNVTGNFTIEITVSGIVYYCPITITTQNNTTYYSTPNSSGIALLEWTTPDGYTDAAFVFKNYTTDAVFGSNAATPTNQINLRNATRIEVKKGWYGGPTATPSYINLPTDSQYRLWFIQTPATWIGQGSGGTSLLLTSFNWLTTIPTLRMQSQSLNYFAATPNGAPPATPNAWMSDVYTYTIKLNGVAPNMTQQNFTLNLPKIIWPASTINRQYVIELSTFSGTTYGAYSDATAATPVFVPSSQLLLNGSSAWTIGGKAQSLTYLSTTAVFSSNYNTTTSVWSLFEASQISQLPSGTVDENGPYIAGRPAPKLNKDFQVTNLNLTRDDFGIPNTTNYIITWMGVDTVSNNNVLMWLNTNSVYPAVTDSAETGLTLVYPSNTIVETLNTTTSKYVFSKFPVYAKLKPGVNDKWNPKLYSGYFYDDVDEYYMYANPVIESATANTKTLSGLNRQGAPLIIKAMSGTSVGKELRQVAFWSSSTPSTATPTTTTTQILQGNGSKTLYAAYKDIYNISVWDNTVNQTVSVASATSADNIIRLAQNTNVNHSYSVTYTVRYAYAVDNDYIDTDGQYKSRIYFDQSPAQISATTYNITYESSIYDPATPVDVPLNPMYTSVSEGFVFIDHDIRPLTQLEVKISPSILVADGNDYALITFRSYDNVGNPKPFQKFQVYTNWGAIDKTIVTTDRDGFGYATLTSKLWAGSGINQATPATPNALPAATPGSNIQGYILAATPGLNAKAGFQIQLLPPALGKVYASMDSASIISDGRSATAVFGLVEDAAHRPLANTTVYWNKARTMYELFKNRKLIVSAATPGSRNLSGSVTTDSKGRFSIGPFISSTTSGYWFVSTEAIVPATPSTYTDYRGDVVYWYEYPNITSGIDTVSSNIIYPTQSATPSWKIPQYSFGSAFPTTYDEATPRAITAATPSLVWTPPKWYAIDRYKQYQMGLLGNATSVIAATPAYPSYKEI